MSPFIILLLIYLVTGTIISSIVYRARQTQEEYYVGGRRIGGFLSSLTYASTTYSAFMMVGLVGLSFKTGLGSLIFEISYLVGTITLLTIYGKKIWKLGRQKGFISPMELFVHRYGSISGSIAAIIAVIALIPYTSSQVIGLAIIFQSFGGFRFIVGITFAAVIIALWAFIGGLRGVAITDALQGMFMIIAAISGFIWARGHFGGFETLRFPNEFWTTTRFIDFTLPWFFFALTSPQVMQRLFIPKNKRSFNSMILYFGIFGLFYTLMVTFIGFAARYGAANGLFPLSTGRDEVILELFRRMSGWLSLPIALSIVFASVSTANSIILTLSSMISRDVFREKNRIWIGKCSIVVLTGFVFLFSMTRPNYIVELSVASSSILLCLLPLLFGIFHWDYGKEITAVATLILGAGTAIAMRILNVPLGSLYTLIVAFTVFIVSGLAEGKKERT
jgi:SSS family solute:Na+ symporter